MGQILKTIPLLGALQGALLDDEDYARLVQFSWSGASGYAATKVDGKTTYMHRLVMDAPVGIEVDHINRNRTDNRRINLRLATRQENSQNMSPHSDSRSKFKGVSWETQTGKWRAQFKSGALVLRLGRHNTEEEAARAYDAAVVYHLGSSGFAYLNFPDE